MTKRLPLILLALLSFAAPAAAQQIVGFPENGIYTIPAPFAGGGPFSGQLQAPQSSDCAAPPYSYQGDLDTGLARTAADTISTCIAGFAAHLTDGDEIRFGSAYKIGWSSNVDPRLAAADTAFFRGAAGVIGVGGATSSFPGFRRSSTTLQFVLADGSADAPISALSVTTPTVQASSSLNLFSGGGFGQTIANATGGVTISAGTLGANAFTISTAATNDDPTELARQQRATTTDATPTTIDTITIPASTTVLISCMVLNRRTGGASGTAEDGAGYRAEVVMKNVAGTATEIAAETTTTIGESIAGYNVTMAPSSATELVQVTGAATTNITWHSTCRTYPVGS